MRYANAEGDLYIVVVRKCTRYAFGVVRGLGSENHQ